MLFVVSKMSVLFVKVIDEVVTRISTAVPAVAVVSEKWVIATGIEVGVNPGAIAKVLTIVPVAKAISTLRMSKQMNKEIDAGIHNTSGLVIPGNI